MNIPKISNAHFQGKLKLGGLAQIVRKSSLGEFPITNFNKHKVLIEDTMFPESKSYEIVQGSKKLAQQGIYPGNFVVDTKDIKEIDEEKLTLKQPLSDYTTYIYHTHPNYGTTDYNHILKAYIAASMNDDIVVNVENDKTPWEA